MAARKPNKQTRYRTYGSAAYQPEYDGTAVRPARRQPVQPQPRPQVRPRRNVIRRPQILIREAGAFSPLALMGMVIICVCATMLLVANARLMVIKDQTVKQTAVLRTLRDEQNSLLAQRELLYDLDAIEAQLTADGSMVKPQSSQITYLNAVERDSVVVFREQERGLDALTAGLKNLFWRADA